MNEALNVITIWRRKSSNNYEYELYQRIILAWHLQKILEEEIYLQYLLQLAKNS